MIPVLVVALVAQTALFALLIDRAEKRAAEERATLLTLRVSSPEVQFTPPPPPPRPRAVPKPKDIAAFNSIGSIVVPQEQEEEH